MVEVKRKGEDKMYKPSIRSVAIATFLGALALAPAAVASQPVTMENTYSYGPEDTGIVCGSDVSAFHVYDSAKVTIRDVKYYDESGNFLRDDDHLSGAGEFSNPLTGASVPYTIHQTVIFVQSIPGDLSSPVTINGMGEMNFVAPSMGAIVVNAGRVVDLFNGETDTFLQIVGRQDFWDGNAAALQRLCTALGAV
jgi:hypothetical protein